MEALRFAGEDALQVALGAGVLPPALVAEPASVWRSPDGALRVAPRRGVPRDLKKSLVEFGIPVEKVVGEGEPHSCWPEIVRTRADREPPPESGPILFVLDERSAAHDGSTPLVDLAAELLRLGCDRMSWRLVDGAALLRASSPPYYTLARAMDRVGGLAAYRPAVAGKEQVWLEVGHTHALAHALHPDGEELVLIPGSGRWLRVAGGAWSDIYELVDLALPAAAPPLTRSSTERPGRLRVPLRLAPAPRNEAPSLWVLRGARVAEVDRLVAGLPDEVVSRLLFASLTAVTVAEEGGPAGAPLVVLKARPGPQGPPALSIDAEAYAPLLQMANLFVPHDALVEPPLRRDRLRELLAPAPERLSWLAPIAGQRGAFTVESLDESALCPLSEWVDYVIDGGAQALAAWARSSLFAFEAFESVGAEWSDRPRHAEHEPEPDPEPDARARKRRSRKTSDEEEVATVAAPVRAAELPVPATPTVPLVIDRKTGPLAEALAAVERRFLDADVPADHPSRQPLWLEMAELNARLDRRRDAGLCYTRALWELDGAPAHTVAVRWAEAEALLAGPAFAALAATTPSRDDTRAVVAQLVASPPRDAAAAQRFLDAHDDNLDLRSLWLGRRVLATLAGGDRLALARTRDRILTRLHRGLSVEKDVPTFLRFTSGAGSAGGAGAGNTGAGDRGSMAADRIVTHLEALLARFLKAKRTRSPVEAPPDLTRAYVLFQFAYGMARLGRGERAAELERSATQLLAPSAADPVHHFLARAYAVRIGHAREGLPPETALPPELAGELNALEKFLRYKVDRLRQISTVLEPQERLDPILAFQRGGADPRGDALAHLRGMTDTGELARAVAQVIERALLPTTPPVERADLCDGAMDFFPQLAESQAVPLLERVVTGVSDVDPPRRVQVLEEALMLAGHFGRGELVKDIFAELERLLGSLGTDQAAVAAGAVGSTLRTLRRVGLRDEAARLLATLGKATLGKATGGRTTAGRGVATPILLARLHLAAGLSYLGRPDDARPILDEAWKALAADPPMTERLQLVRGLAQALAQTPQDQALSSLGRLVDLLPGITDSFNTNTHFCLSVVGFMESLVLGYASEDLALGELGRQWLDEDEYLVRRRVNRDLAG